MTKIGITLAIVFTSSLGVADTKDDDFLARAARIIEPASKRLSMMPNLDPATDWKGAGPKLIKEAQACKDDLDQLVASGAPTKKPVPGYDQTIPQLRVTYCETFARAAAAFAAAQQAAGADLAEFEKPFRAVGVSGQKLQLIELHRDLQGIGGVKLTTPKQFAKASRLFFLGRDTRDGTWHIDGWTFKGNDIVDQTDVEYLTKPGPRAFR